MSHTRLPSLFCLLTLVAASLIPSTPQSVAGESRSFSHVQGTTIIPAVPQRVVALDLGALDTLDALQIPIVGVPLMDVARDWPEYLQKYVSDDYVKCGSLFEPEIDAITALKPDLIIIGGRSSRHLESLSKIAPTIDLSTSTTAFVPSVIENVLTLGAIFDIEDRANQLSRQLLEEIRSLQAKTATHGSGLVLFTVDDKVIPSEPATRWGIVYELTGIDSVVSVGELPQRPRGGRDDSAGSSKTPAQIAAQQARAQDEADKLFSSIVARDPQWLFVIDRNSAFGDRENSIKVLSKNSLVAEANAMKAGRVVHLDGVGWYLIGGGPQQLRNTIAHVNTALDSATVPSDR